MSGFKEVEFKYNAKDITREQFNSLVPRLGFIKKKLRLNHSPEEESSSVDHYFTFPDPSKSSKKRRFMRWRESYSNSGSKTWELTSKAKLQENGNIVRDEVNIQLNASSMNFSKAEEFSFHHGCVHDFSIKKDVQVFWIGKVVLSHYTTFTENNKKLHSFLEIEANESYPWGSVDEALEEIVKWEKMLSPLGITPQNRIKRSLFEFYSGKIKKEEGSRERVN